MHRPLTFAAALALAATTYVSPARAAWGCRAVNTFGLATRTWGSNTEERAREYALQLCRKEWTGYGCQITECRPNIDNQEQATALWPVEGSRNCYGTAKC
jgi:hypothetical protein